MSTRNFKSSITQIPNYLDGYMKVYERKNISETDFPEYAYVSTGHLYPYEKLAIFDRTKFEAFQQNIQLTHKIRLPESKEITSEHIIKLEDGYHKIFNVAHFRNKEGFKQTELTLVKQEGYINIVEDE